jgi:hypothetical protein
MNPSDATKNIALLLLIPKSINVLVAISTIEIKDVTAAKKSARKKIDAKKILIISLEEILENKRGR